MDGKVEKTEDVEGVDVESVVKVVLEVVEMPFLTPDNSPSKSAI